MAAPSPIRLATPALRGPVACVDLETTGGVAALDRVIEVGIVLLEDGSVVEEWSSLVNPGRRIPASIESFTGISNDMVRDAPPFEELSSDIGERLAGRLFIAHNARFDYGFLRNEFRRTGGKFSAPVLCTVRLSRLLHSHHRRHNLDTLIDRFDLQCGQRHRALGDAAVLPALLAAFESTVGTESLAAAIDTVRNDSRLPAHLPPDLADDLPEGPGVYVFRGDNGTPLYVGMSRALRSRVLAHFAASQRTTREAKLAQQVRSVEWIETGGEFGALLLEARMVRELAPTANRRLRKTESSYCIRLQPGNRALQPRVEPLTGDAVENEVETYGPFRTERDARRAIEGKAREAGLCLKVLGLETGEGSCFAYQLGRCRGACVGREPLPLHDARLRLALSSLRLKPWPFDGPVGIREPSARGDAVLLHIIDRWRHLGTASDAAAIAALLRTTDTREFDPDSYRIVTRCLERVAPRDVVVLRRDGRTRG